jgi:hypothetical protein
MVKRNTTPASPGTFAQLYDVHEEMSRRNPKPLGRPPKKVQRKPTTIHLTQAESRNLSKLHLLVNEQFPANRSELVGLAIEVLVALIAKGGDDLFQQAEVRDVDALRQRVFDFMKS